MRWQVFLDRVWAGVKEACACASPIDTFEREMAALADEAKRYKYKVHEAVHKTGGDYEFQGWVMMRGTKRKSGLVRYAVENQQGLVHVFNEGQLQPGWPDLWTEKDIP